MARARKGKAAGAAGAAAGAAVQVAAEAVVVLLGDAWYPRWRFCRDLAGRGGRKLLRVRGPQDAPWAARAGAGALWLVEGADQVALADLAAAAAEAGALLLLQADADPPAGSDLATVVQQVGAGRVRSFRKPAPGQEHEGGVEFVRAEMLDHGVAAGSGVGELLAQGAGGDLGYLRLEVLKLVALARARGVALVGVDLAEQVAGGPIHGDLDRVAAALGEANSAALGEALLQVRAAVPRDPTARLLAVLDRAVGQWLCAAMLGDPDPERAAREVGVHPYVYRLRVAGPARRWRLGGLLRVLSVLAGADEAMRAGAPNPFVALAAGLLRACLDLGQGKL